MAILQPVIERKLSALLGADVSFENLNLSLLAGSIEVIGLKAGDFVTVVRVVAKVSATKALKGEIVVKSVTIERPVIEVEKLPKRVAKRGGGPAPAAIADGDDDKTRWKMDVEKLLVVDGQINIKPGMSVKKLLLELKRAGDGYGVTMLADSALGLGQLKGTGTISNVPDLAAIMNAAASATLELGDIGKLKVQTPRLASKSFDVSFDGHIDLPRILKLLVPSVRPS